MNTGRLRAGVTRRTRLLAALLAVAQFAVATLLPALDASLEARSTLAVAHAEATTTKACAPTHDHVRCQVCRTLLAGPPAGHAPGTVAVVARGGSPTPATAVRRPAPATHDDARPRAPPAA